MPRGSRVCHGERDGHGVRSLRAGLDGIGLPVAGGCRWLGEWGGSVYSTEWLARHDTPDLWREVSMEKSIYSHEVFLTGQVIVMVRRADNGRPVTGQKVTFKSCGFT